MRAGDVPYSQADITVARERLGYAVIVPFAEGVVRCVAAYRGAMGRPLAEEPDAAGPTLSGRPHSK
jgi:hypothetical protein